MSFCLADVLGIPNNVLCVCYCNLKIVRILHNEYYLFIVTTQHYVLYTSALKTFNSRPLIINRETNILTFKSLRCDYAPLCVFIRLMCG